MLIKCTHISCNLTPILLHFIYVLSMRAVLCGPKIGCKVDQIYADSKNLATRDVPNPSNLYLITFNYTDLGKKKRISVFMAEYRAVILSI